MKLTKKLLATATALTTLTACRAYSPALTAPPRAPAPKVNYKIVESTSEGKVIEIDTRVDILFIIDDSRSMERHQKKLSENINAFVDEIAKIKAIDFHIGYTVAHDSSRYDSGIVPRVCGNGLDPKGRDTTIPNWEDAGTLRPLKGAESLNGRRYVTNDDDFRAILKASLDPLQNKFLVKDLIDKSPENPSVCPYGPQEEELFTPLLGAVTNPIVTEGANKGFRRDGALFIAVIVSDAKDASGKTAQEVKSRIEDAVGSSVNKRRFRAFSVAINPGLEIGPGSNSWSNCRPDPAFATGRDKLGNYIFNRRAVADDENPLVSLAKLTEDENNGKVDQTLSICDENYGGKLASFGKLISQDTLSDVEIQLNRRWDVTNTNKALKVFIGDTQLVEGQHWSANPYDLTVTIFSQKIDWNKHKGEKIRVSFTPAIDGLSTTRSVTARK